ncbi:MAG: lamin tail domain-containing protein, partial [Flavobacteriales bacterium]
MKIRLTALVCLIALATQAQNMNLRINEIIADNQAGMMDGFFQREDWIEIYNPPGNPITNLAGYYLTDNPDSLDKWQIPNTNPGITNLLPNNFMIFWIDDDSIQGPDHTGNNFKLSADGEVVLLVAPDAMTIIDSITYPVMGPDISYGRSCDGCPEWQYFNNVTFDDNNFEIQNTELLFINEVQASQDSYYDDLQGEFDPWFEIFNPNSFQVNLANYVLEVSGSSPWTVPNDNPYRTVIPAGGFMLIWCDGDLADDSNHAPIELNASGGTITLRGPDNETVDTYVYSAVPNNQSWGRQNDGSPLSIVFEQPTPTVTNSLIFIQPLPLVINEIMTANQTGIVDNQGEFDDWFEIYNPNDQPINIGGYYFSDNPENPTKWIVPVDFADSVTVPANGWRLFWADADQEQGVRHANFRLSNNGEYLGMFSPDGFTIVDELQWAHINPDTSYGRLTDGSEEWVLFVEPTPDASNNGALIEVKEFGTETFAAYPNPAADIIRFNTLMDIEIYSIS